MTCLAPAGLTSSLEHSMPNAPMPVVMPSVQPVPYKHQVVGSSDNHRMQPVITASGLALSTL